MQITLHRQGIGFDPGRLCARFEVQATGYRTGMSVVSCGGLIQLRKNMMSMLRNYGYVTASIPSIAEFSALPILDERRFWDVHQRCYVLIAEADC